MKAVPVITNAVAAFGLSGDEITELVAVDQRGNWRTIKLLTPTVSECMPIVGNDVAAYVVDGRVYAFSGLTGTWDSIPSKAAPSVDQTTSPSRPWTRLPSSARKPVNGPRLH